MPIARNLALYVAATTLLMTGSAPAEARRSAQSLPTLARFSMPAPSPARVPNLVRAIRPDDSRLWQARVRIGMRGDGWDRDRDGDRRNDKDRDDREKGRGRDGHGSGHHGRDDSPGC